MGDALAQQARRRLPHRLVGRRRRTLSGGAPAAIATTSSSLGDVNATTPNKPAPRSAAAAAFFWIETGSSHNGVRIPSHILASSTSVSARKFASATQSGAAPIAAA